MCVYGGSLWMEGLCGWTDPGVANKLSRLDISCRLKLASGRRPGIFPTRLSGQDGHV